MLKDIRTCPTFVINLDRRPDRWSSFSKQAELQEFRSVERFSAVDGSKLDIVKDERISPHTKMNIKTKYRRSDYEINTPGAIGASLSHIGIWETFLKTNQPYVVVFEDDTVVDKASLILIDKLIKELPADWDMWLLGTHRWSFKGKPLDKLNPDSWLSVQQFTGAHAYVLSRKGAELLLKEAFPIETHIEYYISACANLYGLKLIRHPSLRMRYSMEDTEIDDSDTFVKKTCPLCSIPDDYKENSFMMSHEALVAVLAFLFVGAGGLVGWRLRKI